MSEQEAIDLLVNRAEQARVEFLQLDQQQVDEIIKQMTLAGVEQYMELAKLAVEETKRGVFEDKCTKNLFATEEIYHSIKYNRTVGVISQNEEEDYYEVAEPVGVLAGITPVTNPTSTVMFKSLIAMKTRNPIIFSFHPGAQQCSAAAAKLMRHAAVLAGAPAHCIGWIEYPSIEATKLLMNHPGVAMVLATGGAGMVRSAYSTGKPALGVGPGNVPCYIEKTAHLRRAVNDLIMSKTFDNGMICASEQAVILDGEIAAETVCLMEANGCYFLKPEEIALVEQMATCEASCSLNADVVGRSALEIAQMAGITVPTWTKILVAPLTGVGPDYPLSREKLSPILACYTVEGTEEGLRVCEQMLEFGGLGHTAVIHSENDQIIEDFSRRMKTGRIIVNSPASQGAIGELYNKNTPSLTLGCGTMGHNSTTSNVSTSNLINVKRVAKRRTKMQWFRIPERIYFEAGSLQYLAKMPNLNRVMVVSDAFMLKLGHVDKLIYHLHKRQNQVIIDVFSEVEPDPSLDTVLKGYEAMQRFNPDTIIAIGGGSVLDAAKGMWLYYEYPEVDFDFLKLKFLDMRNRTYKYPKLGRKAQMVAIPTTSGTGSEVTAFAVISDKGQQVKYPLADYELTPDVALIDFDLVMTVPPQVTADTGMDVLTHALEAYVSVMASDYTDGLALKAIELVFKFLPRVYAQGEDREAREKMHNASTIAGMAFTNAFLGVNHSLAHQLGGEFHLPHGRANALLLPYVIAYNSQLPSKLAAFSKYEWFKAPERYREVARFLGLAATTPREGVGSLVTAIQQLMHQLEMPQTIAACGISEQAFIPKVSRLAEKAFADQTTITNPRTPLVAELADIYRRAYYGTDISIEEYPSTLMTPIEAGTDYAVHPTIQ
jgi:acetaldehyde dehydrogenase/alcohol dehydrogenase